MLGWRDATMHNDPLALAFLAERSVPTLPTSEIGSQLEAGYQAGRCKWPAFELPPDCFAAHVATRVPEEADLELALESMQLADLYLACGCAQRISSALETFDRNLLSKVPTFIAGIGSEPDFVDEVTQRLRIKLLVGAGAESARIGQYSGRGPLDSWVCAAAVRLALDLRRAPASREGADIAELALTDVADVETQHLRDRYAESFRLATSEALGRLGPKERNLLRFYYFERLTLDKIGALHRVHATTVMRWLAEIRETILLETRTILSKQLNLSESAFGELAPLLRSQLDVSVRRILAIAR